MTVLSKAQAKTARKPAAKRPHRKLAAPPMPPTDPKTLRVIEAIKGLKGLR